ncbi:MAG: class I SAM-dependent methyltransferase [Phycisphaerae bacterium]|nr:class I SAM-dependent methyltransferase [Phycisphaerae bacterium]
MKNGKKRGSREIGLEIAVICGRYFLKLQHLHYGYWSDDLDVDIANLGIAQENYAQFLISHIPEGVARILDVGCGMGQVASELVRMGYGVDCVSPSSYLSRQARELLSKTSRVFECYYEALHTENRYDLILFAESFQYINPEKGIKKTLELLRPGGYMLICDVFRKDLPGQSPLSGGHPLTRLQRIVAESPLELVKDVDITAQTAPSIDIENEVLQEVVKPTVDLIRQLLESKYPIMSKSLRFLYGKKMDKMNKKYFSGLKTSENFKKWKTYRLLLYRRIDFAEPC